MSGQAGGGAGGVARVVFVVGSTVGGTGRHVAMLARGCLAAGGEVSVFGPEAARSLFPAGAVFSAVEIGDRPRPDRDVALVRRLAGLLRETAPEVVHAHGLRAGALACLARPPGRGGRPGRPGLVVTVHNAPPAGAGRAAVYGVLEHLVASRADVVLCVSADLVRRMRRRGAREVARAVVPAPAAAGGIAARPDLEAIRARLGAQGRPLVLAAGRLTSQKGFDLLIAAAARLEAAPGEAGAAPLLVIAGEGPDRPALAELSRRLGVDVHLAGARTDLPDLLAAADLFVMPSRWEGQPLVLQEALRAGRPVVAFDVGGMREVAGDAALLVPAGDVTALAGSIRRVLAEPGLAAGLRERAIARAAKLPAEADAIEIAIATYRRLSLPAERR